MFSKSFSISFIHVTFCPPLGFLHIFFASFSACFAGTFSGSLRRLPYQFIAFAFVLHYSMMSVLLFYKDDRLILCLAI